MPEKRSAKRKSPNPRRRRAAPQPIKTFDPAELRRSIRWHLTGRERPSLERALDRDIPPPTRSAKRAQAESSRRLHVAVAQSANSPRPRRGDTTEGIVAMCQREYAGISRDAVECALLDLWEDDGVHIVEGRVLGRPANLWRAGPPAIPYGGQKVSLPRTFLDASPRARDSQRLTKRALDRHAAKEGQSTTEDEPGGLGGYVSADTLSMDQGIRPQRLSEAARDGKVKTKPAPQGTKDSRGRAVYKLYHQGDARKHCSPQHVKKATRQKTGLPDS